MPLDRRSLIAATGAAARFLRDVAVTGAAAATTFLAKMRPI